MLFFCNITQNYQLVIVIISSILMLIVNYTRTKHVTSMIHYTRPNMLTSMIR
jgi:hypothetical protein